ncbi:MAG TPA: hypothetical protein VGK29_11115 [Paludibaculum sp.]|jgi:DUF4097 and DUF4098 domain-containing protein YvlB
MMLRPLIALILAYSLACEAQQKGSGCPSASRVRVNATGKVKVVSEDRKDVAYVLSGAGKGQVKTTLRDGWCIIVVSTGDGSFSQELMLALPRTVRFTKLDNRSGSISARFLQGDVTAATNAGSIEMDEIGGDVNARTGGGQMTFGTVGGSLRCLSGGGTIRAKKIGKEGVLESAGGEILVDEGGSWLRLSTSGNIHVGRVAQSLFAYTAAGLIDVDRAGGMVTAETASGSIQIGGAHGVRCESAAGGIRLKNVSGGVRAATASGTVTVSLAAGQSLENSYLASGRGDVTVFVPSNLAVTIKAMNESPGSAGSVFTDFPEIQRMFSTVGRQNGPAVAQGNLNGGGPVLMLSAAGGAISIKRQK